MEIKSNIPNIGKKIEVEGRNGEARKIITEILKNIESELVLIGLIYVGRRIITETNTQLISGRRHRRYYGLKTGKRIYIKFGWHKIKKLTENELIYVKQNWRFNLFEKEGSHLVEKSGGILSPNHLVYTKAHINI